MTDRGANLALSKELSCMVDGRYIEELMNGMDYDLDLDPAIFKLPLYP